MTTIYSPRHGSLAQKMCNYLMLNVSQTMTIDDIDSLWETSRGNIHTQLRDPVEGGWLARNKNDDGEYVYTAGANLPRLTAGINIDAVQQGRKPNRAPTHLDIEQLQICDDPLPASQARPQFKYHPKFAKMALGQALRCPTADVGKVSGAMRKYIELKSLKAKVKSTREYADDAGFGRVWLLDAKAAV